MKKFSVTHRIVLTVFIFLLNGCGSNGNTGGNPNVQVNEVSNSTTSYDETIHINNCGGKADSEQIKERSFSTSIEGGIDVGVQQVVVGVISAKYSQSRNTSVSQKLVAPAGTDMEFVLRWKEEVRAGNVIVNGNTGTYTVKIPIAVEQVSSQDLGCSGVSLPTIPTQLPAQPPVNPTSIPVQPTMPLPSLCPDYVSRSVVQTWNIGEANVPIVDAKVAEFNKYRTYPRGNFIEGDKIPAGVIVATSFDGAGKSWTEFPVQPLVHRGNYGLFETLREYIAPYEGACISIAP